MQLVQFNSKRLTLQILLLIHFKCTQVAKSIEMDFVVNHKQS